MDASVSRCCCFAGLVARLGTGGFDLLSFGCSFVVCWFDDSAIISFFTLSITSGDAIQDPLTDEPHCEQYRTVLYFPK